MKYAVPFTDTKERDRIRKWAGITKGASILKKSGDWSITDGNGFTGGFTVTETYIVEVKNKKVELLLKLQFSKAHPYVEKDGALESWEDWLDVMERR